jgi:hypothetical protein
MEEEEEVEGGGQIVDYISASLVEMLANGRSPAQALAMGHVSTAVKGRLQLEKGSNAALMAPALNRCSRHGCKETKYFSHPCRRSGVFRSWLLWRRDTHAQP